jgi:pyruvate/2-oxoglutarate dehydrogenase complex dihydrolipoamide acyltransferase (E2) component
MPETQDNLDLLNASGATEGAFNAAEEAGISLSKVKGTGKNLKITLTDVKNHLR